MKEKPEAGTAQSWLAHARSNLKLAETSDREGVFLEDLCFEAQQAAEKALKALCLWRGLDFPRAHSLVLLTDVLEEAGVEIPPEVKETDSLSVYAVEMGHPSWAEPVEEDEYQAALVTASRVVDWVEKQINK
jgi:HEPN domain-containing protein